MVHVNQAILGRDPDRTHRINANSFQQDAIKTHSGWQYAVYYTAKDSTDHSPLFVTIARRNLNPPESWQTVVLSNYEQTIDDGHNTISLGISGGDGRIHLSFDHHCSQLNYIVSNPGVASAPESHPWSPSIFTFVQHTLPGDKNIRPDFFREVSYPRFVSVDEDMLFAFRIGQAGSGSEVLYRYSSTTSHFTYAGTYLTGSGNSPYPNGLDYRRGKLHVSWCYRGFVEYEGVHDSASTAHKAQAGPNGPENNYDLCYMYSDGLPVGKQWRGNDGGGIATITAEEEEGEGKGTKCTVMPDTKGIRVFEIPKGSGILNQESQCMDWTGRFHVLNRENGSGVERWYVYSRDRSGVWRKTMVPDEEPTETGSRGTICADRKGFTYIVLPGNGDDSLKVKRLDWKSEQFEQIWHGKGYDGEPLVDLARLETEDVMSIFTRTNFDDDRQRQVVVLDIDLSQTFGSSLLTS